MYQLLRPSSQAALTPLFVAWDTGYVLHNWVVQRKAGFTDLFRSKMLASVIKTPLQLLIKIDLNGRMDMKTSKLAPFKFTKIVTNDRESNKMKQHGTGGRTLDLDAEDEDIEAGMSLLLRDLDIQRSAIQEVGDRAAVHPQAHPLQDKLKI